MIASSAIMPSSAREHEGFRDKLRQRFYRFRPQSEGRLKDISIKSVLGLVVQFLLMRKHSSTSSSQYAKSDSGPFPVNQMSEISRQSTKPSNDQTVTQTGQTAVHSNRVEHNSTPNQLIPGADPDCGVASSNLWSAAYREAVESLGEEIDIAILKGENVTELFRQLEEIDEEVTQESTFVRGVKYLRSIQVPLEKFKLALDLASPLANIEPTATTVVGVVRSVTAVSSVPEDISNCTRISDSYLHRSPSAWQLLIWTLRSK